MMLRYITTFIAFIVLCVVTAMAQDVSFSNLGAVPTAINPALAGSNGTGRAILNYRNQWIEFGSNYSTIRAAADMPIAAIDAGVGLEFMNDRQAKGIFATNAINGVFSKGIKLSKRDEINFGLQLGVLLNSLNASELTFEDQLNRFTGDLQPYTTESLSDKSNTSFDVSVGLNYEFENIFTLGVAAYHLTEPDNNWYYFNNKIPRKYLAYACYNIYFKNRYWYENGAEDNYVSISGIYQQQSNIKQGGILLSALFSPILVGAGFRTDMDKSIIVSASAGVAFNKFQLSYCYDYFHTNKQYLGSAHELALVYYFSTKYDNFCPKYPKH